MILSSPGAERPGQRSGGLALGLSRPVWAGLVLLGTALPALEAQDLLPPARLAARPGATAMEAREDPASMDSAEPREAPAARWYLQRGTGLREPRVADDIPRVLGPLVERMREGQVPGFYDGQFAELAGEFDALARLARDGSVEHTLRLMAVMALQEAGDGEALATQLEPLLLSVAEEFNIELKDFWDNGDTVREDYVRQVLAADLSRHVRFALAKDGQEQAVREKIEVMEHYIANDRAEILDPSIRPASDPSVAQKRAIWFDIAYHYQQFDDYRSAAWWFGQLCDNLSGDETRWAHYNLACMAAIQGESDSALKELKAAFEAGFLDVAWMLEDGDLTSLHDEPRFLELARQMGADGLEPAQNPNSLLGEGAGNDAGESP